MVKQHERYRSRDEIRTILLNHIKEYEPKGIFRTRLMMLGNITNLQLHDYLQEMLSSELIRCDTSRVKHVAASGRKGVSSKGDTWHITQKGIKYLLMMDDMKQKMGIKI